MLTSVGNKGIDFSFLWTEQLVVLAYHGVYARKGQEPSDVWKLHVLLSDLQRQLKVFSRFFTFVTLNEVVQHYLLNRPLPRFSALLTFDDGYKSILEPVGALQQSGFPVTVFLVTGQVGKEMPFWWDRLEAMVMSTRRKELRLDIEGQSNLLVCPTETRKDKLKTIWFLRSILQRSPQTTRERLLKNLAEKLDFDPLQASKAYSSRATLSWEEIAGLKRNGVTFASHTVNHEVMKDLSEAELKTDLLESRRTILERLGECPEVLCYPYGKDDFLDERSIRCVKEVGFKIAFVNYRARNSRNGSPFLLGRINMNNYCPRRLASLRYALYCLKELANLNE